MKSRHPWLVVQDGLVMTAEMSEDIRETVARTRAAQGLPPGITDAATIERLLVLLGYPRRRA